ncbi:histidine kinase dimerization/phospho-acceptor domain-containing protein [Salinisphaera sp. P385]|uniref:histidine kinase n=1 Tax=Spectribacter acetivorans TaxID=3075603 RepID=A0ABU3BCP8_9GAMM|nr:ATP-binding protein [Salinisphaera sp. P385]MDT0619790.1 histidine kinase dimerization/phospho-acceptor domain-containing protein [Salinisphaera sp. P385]
MSTNPAITPPFVDQDWRAMRALNLYRWVVAVGAAVLYLNDGTVTLFSVMWPALFAFASVAYLLLCIPSALAAYRRWPSLSTQVYLLIGTDIAFVVALVLASGGVRDGLAVLLIAPLAGASMLVQPRMAMLFAAVASLSLLGEEGWRYLRYADGSAAWVQTGILGALFFLTALTASGLARQARTSAALAAARKSELDDLSALNERIIQQMTIGLLVIDENRCVRLINRAGRDMLGIDNGAIGQRLASVMPALSWAMQAWLLSPGRAADPVSAGDHSVIPHFSRLGAGEASPVLIFLEDARRVSEAAQQIKLAALGRLTASIAHEIRNPLSAINHAGQLLDESDRLDPDDRKLLDIVHRHTQRIDAIVQSVLGLSRRGQALPARLDLAAWLPRAIHDYQQSQDTPADIRLVDLPASLDIQVDADQLRRIVYNLLENAERHARREDAPLIIRLAAGRTDAGEVWLDVADNGPGMPDHVAEHLMEPFFTTDSNGTGLGLYVTRELCESNFARISVAQVRPGARFRILFARPDLLGPALSSPPQVEANG